MQTLDGENIPFDERTKAGLEAAKAAGQKLGRPKALTPDQVRQAIKLIEAGRGLPKVALAFKVWSSTLRAAIALYNINTRH